MAVAAGEGKTSCLSRGWPMVGRKVWTPMRLVSDRSSRTSNRLKTPVATGPGSLRVIMTEGRAESDGDCWAIPLMVRHRHKGPMIDIGYFITGDESSTK